MLFQYRPTPVVGAWGQAPKPHPSGAENACSVPQPLPLYCNSFLPFKFSIMRN